MTRAAKLRTWAERLYEQHAADIAALIGAEEIPNITVHVEHHGPGAAWTNGTRVFLSRQWFTQHPDDVGGVLHEFTHAIMRAPTYDETTIWLIEGLADYVRDELGYDAPWTKAHFEPGKATAGYQTTAHFLQYLERTYPGTVKRLAQALMDDTYIAGRLPPVHGQARSRSASASTRPTRQPPDSKEGRGSPRGASLSPRGAPPALHAHAQPSRF